MLNLLDLYYHLRVINATFAKEKGCGFLLKAKRVPPKKFTATTILIPLVKQYVHEFCF
jgi:hypothetical protein